MIIIQRHDVYSDKIINDSPPIRKSYTEKSIQILPTFQAAKRSNKKLVSGKKVENEEKRVGAMSKCGVCIPVCGHLNDLQ
jgi:hypothetical protein